MRLIDADKVYPWYLEAFSAEKIGKEKEIKPNEVKFSMNDIRENLSNIATEIEPKTDILEQIRTEINKLSPTPTAEDVVDGNAVKDAIWDTLFEVNKVIDKAIKEVSE